MGTTQSLQALLITLFVGVISAFLAGWMHPLLGIVIGSGLVGAMLQAFVGGVVRLFPIGLVRKA